MTQTLDMAKTPLREVNETLQRQKAGANKTEWMILNPKGSHAVAVGLDGPIKVTVKAASATIAPA